MFQQLVISQMMRARIRITRSETRLMYLFTELIFGRVSRFMPVLNAWLPVSSVISKSMMRIIIAMTRMRVMGGDTFVGHRLESLTTEQGRLMMSFTTSPPIISPAAAGTKALLAGIMRFLLPSVCSSF